jgi:RNA polymerase sigma-70 factor (ECF subfamily)
MFARVAAFRAFLAPHSTGVYSVVCGGQNVVGKPELETSDEALLRRVAEGDINAYQVFYQRYSGRILSYARQLSHNNRDFAEDVVQEVFVAVWRRAGSYRPDRGDPAGWLYTITRNKMVDLWRKHGDGSEMSEIEEETAAVASDPVDDQDLRVTVRQALARVSVEQRRAIELAYSGGLTYEETAQRLELPVGTLKSRIRAGLKSLRLVLESA